MGVNNSDEHKEAKVWPILTNFGVYDQNGSVV